MKPKNIIGISLLLLFGTLLLVNFGNQVGGYMHFAEAEDSGEFAHVVGEWVDDRPTNYDRDDNLFTFHMRDDLGQVREVRYHNPRPASFEDADKVVVEGQFEGDVFVAEHILMKCPSKYNDVADLSY